MVVEENNQINQSFNLNGGCPRQSMNLDELYDTSTEAQTILRTLIAQVKEAAGIEEGDVGPNKKRADALRKASHRFDGDAHLLTDIVRGKIIIDNVDQLEAVMNIFKDPTSEPLKTSGINVNLTKNNFETPKEYTGYRGLSYKLEIPIKDSDKPHIVELQIVSTAMEHGNDTTYIMDGDNEERMSIYDGTHFHKRKAEDLYRDADNEYKTGSREKPELTDEELTLASQHYAVCLYYNSKIAHEEGYDKLLLDKDKHAFTPEKEKELITHMAEIGIEP